MFPFPITKEKFQYPFGVKVLATDRPLLLQNANFETEVPLKRNLLESNQSLYFQMLQSAEDAAKECVEVLLKNTPWLDRKAASEDGQRKTDSTDDVEKDRNPLLWLGQQVQEDLLLIDGSKDGNQALIGGVVCFPSGWSVQDKIGLSMSQIHQPVPTFEEKLMRPTSKLLGTLRAGRPVWRVNWGVRPSSQLDQSPQHSPLMDRLAKEMTTQSAGRNCFFRLEYQTLSRLPKSGHILFTIHTHQTALQDLEYREQMLLLSNLESCPEEILRYKGIWEMKNSILDYLNGRKGKSSNR